MMGILLFCDVDENGNIIESIVGERIIPLRQYDYFFFITGKNTETVLSELPNYTIVNGELQTA
jgi:hypothetical protein